MDFAIHLGSLTPDEPWVADLLDEMAGAWWLTRVDGPDCDVLLVMVSPSDVQYDARSIGEMLLRYSVGHELVLCVTAPGTRPHDPGALDVGEYLVILVEPDVVLPILAGGEGVTLTPDDQAGTGATALGRTPPGAADPRYDDLDAVDIGGYTDPWDAPTPDTEGTGSDEALERTSLQRQPQADLFEASVFTPAVVEPGVPFLLQLWAYLHDEWDAVERRASKGGSRVEAGSEGSLEAARGSRITALLQIPSLDTEQQRVFVWNGHMTSVGFTVSPPAGCRLGTHVGTITLLIEGAPIGVVSFDVAVGPTAEESERAAPTQLRMLRNAFASYSSRDRPAVLARVQALRAAGIKVFIDVIDLLDGKWRDGLERAIDESDILYLFWSRAAAQSPEVEREWRLGLERRGIDFISPLPLESPDKAPPPPELHDLQFGSIYLRLQEALTAKDE